MGERNDGRVEVLWGRGEGDGGDEGLEKGLHLVLSLWIRDEDMEKKKGKPKNKSQS